MNFDLLGSDELNQEADGSGVDEGGSGASLDFGAAVGGTSFSAKFRQATASGEGMQNVFR
jgi:hypothetical protein